MKRKKVLKNFDKKEQRKVKKERGITLIALVITIIVLLILAAVSIATLTGENGILTKANKAKEVTELQQLKEEVQLEVLAMEMEQEEINTSEVMEDLIQKNIVDKDRHFVKNSSYSLRYCGDIVYKNQVVENVDLTNNSSNLVVIGTAGGTNEEVEKGLGNRTITCKDGVVGKIDSEKYKDKGYVINANKPKQGKKFAYLVDQYDKVISYEDVRSFAGTCVDITYIPIYVNEDKEIEKKNTINIYGTNQTPDGYLVFQSTAVKKEKEAKILSCGIIATKNQDLANEEKLIYNENYENNTEIYQRNGIPNEGAELYSYYWMKTNVGTETWYCRGWCKVQNADGTEEILCSDIISLKK